MYYNEDANSDVCDDADDDDKDGDNENGDVYDVENDVSVKSLYIWCIRTVHLHTMGGQQQAYVHV